MGGSRELTIARNSSEMPSTGRNQGADGNMPARRIGAIHRERLTHLKLSIEIKLTKAHDGLVARLAIAGQVDTFVVK